jgi:hypothetical protein
MGVMFVLLFANNFIHKEFQLLTQQLPVELLQLSKDQQSLSVEIRAVELPVSIELLKQLFDNSAWHHFKLDTSALKEAEQAFKKLSLTTDETRNEENTADQSKQLIQIATRIDAQLSIEIDEKEMNATAILVSAYDGAPVTASDLIETVKELGITNGIDKKIIKRLLKNSHAGDPGARFSATIAKGLSAIPSTNAILKRLVEGKLRDTC